MKRAVNIHVTALNTLVNPCYEAQNPAFNPVNIPFLKKMISDHKIRKALDVGTGEGSFLLNFVKQAPKVKFDAVETNSSLIQLAEHKQRTAADRQINFICSTFSDSFLKSDYDMIMARFAVEHMTDVSGFFRTALKKLKRGGALAIIEYYIGTASIQDPIWLAFRKKEIALYKKIKSHAQISRDLPLLMSRAGFKNISSTFDHVSPVTVGKEAFYNLVSVYAKTYAQIDGKIWNKVFVKKILKWCAAMRKKSISDPMMFVTHTVGYKP